MVLVIIEKVAAPVGVVVQRSGQYKVEFARQHGVFSLSVNTFLRSIAVVVSGNDIAHAEFLVYVLLIVGKIAVYRLDILTVGVIQVVSAVVKVTYLVDVMTDIIT